ncbi:hypothetical protein [Hymenobacter actinosclerus]|uniref:YcxB-like protein n=1 Tax=Hymenobacter actinosclerus TaxID=82805 RepID=A0A1I0GLB2_9BACT|nr:hypothetical protein [Hymenobacter actinosclerus]SET71815.1 hypothetical protein SAMN04487998_2475 [Hymenobacter actinosclerus]
MEPILLTNVHITQADYLDINWPIVMRKRGWISILLTSALITYLFRNDGLYASESWLYRIGITLAIVAIMTVLLGFGYRRAIKKQYNGTPLMQQLATYRLTAAGIEKTSAMQHLELPWASCQGVRRLGRWYFLVTGPQRGEFLDPACLEAPATEVDLRALLQQHGLAFI